MQDGALVNDGPQAAHQMLLFAFAEARFRHKITDLAAGFKILDLLAEYKAGDELKSVL